MSYDMDAKLKMMWQIFLMVFLTAMVGLTVAFIAAPKKVDGYYMSQATQRSGMAVCVWAHWSWHLDEQAFCTNNYQEAVDFATKATAALKGQQ